MMMKGSVCGGAGRKPRHEWKAHVHRHAHVVATQTLSFGLHNAGRPWTVAASPITATRSPSCSTPRVVGWRRHSDAHARSAHRERSLAHSVPKHTRSYRRPGQHTCTQERWTHIRLHATRMSGPMRGLRAHANLGGSSLRGVYLQFRATRLNNHLPCSINNRTKEQAQSQPANAHPSPRRKRTRSILQQELCAHLLAVHCNRTSTASHAARAWGTSSTFL